MTAVYKKKSGKMRIGHGHLGPKFCIDTTMMLAIMATPPLAIWVVSLTHNQQKTTIVNNGEESLKVKKFIPIFSRISES